MAAAAFRSAVADGAGKAAAASNANKRCPSANDRAHAAQVAACAAAAVRSGAPAGSDARAIASAAISSQGDRPVTT